MKKILLIITGSVAAYKSMDLLRLLKKKSFDVTCILTDSAQKFITPLLASSLSGNKTYTEIFSDEDVSGINHIQLSRQSDLIIVAPATADFIAKLAAGYADDLASSVVLAANKKIILAPAMNEKMWEKPQTQKNLQKLVESGLELVDPETDILACGELGVGKMAAPEKICQRIVGILESQNRLKGYKILITGGATFEPIDPVRFIGNYSSGKQAIEIIKVLIAMGADVTMVAANISKTIPLPKGKIIRVKTAEEMLTAVKNNMAGSDVFIGCAAVADFRVKNFSNKKIKKTVAENPTLELTKNPDILYEVGHAQNRPKLVIGFAAEGHDLEKYAREKLQKKNCDLIVANDVEEGEIFGADETRALLISKNKTENLGKILKSELAKILAKKIETK
ncbi:MAG: bifunctional phosphopantothenoylcysteine decarboxylase/phosphopantothenate--cysteine ligase CoaBC [Alphaproteobacteria bacterium]|nr:bifunctional phosphopantothenoylcysteine decarboxylase/phosphopantothenate--cysteine ligase CoaBC [Alphaproteobacteria bacterium]